MRSRVEDPPVPLVNNVGAQVVTSASAHSRGTETAGHRSRALGGIDPPPAPEGVELFVEVGPGKVLSGLVRQIDSAAQCLRVEDSATLNEVITQMARTCGWASKSW